MSRGRTLFDIGLKPVMGSRFQPTGFPDLGHAEFIRPDADGDVRCLLVESAQSMANHLEGTAWDDAEQRPDDVFAGLPYVRVVDRDGTYITSSRTEAHRLASAFIKGSTLGGTDMLQVFRERMSLENDVPLDHRQIAQAVFRLDPFALIHGVFFADNKLPGQPKIARALTSCVEAHDVFRAESGGVKKDHVRHAIDEGSGGSSEGYGSVPFARTEWTARDIVAYFVLDRAQLNSYGLGDGGAGLLESIALWEIRALLDDGLRLRTACDLEPAPGPIVDSGGTPLPSLDELSEQVRRGIGDCADLLEGADVMEVVWSGGKKSK